MRNFVIIFILSISISFSQEGSTENIMEDHDRAVESILSEEIKDQSEKIKKSLAKQSNDVLFAQATYSFLGIVGTIIFEANNHTPVNLIPVVLGHSIVPMLEMRDINESNEPVSLKEMRKRRVRVNSMLGSIPLAKWIIVTLRMPKALLDSIF